MERAMIGSLSLFFLLDISFYLLYCSALLFVEQSNLSKTII